MNEVMTEKITMHPRNPHRFRYDFVELMKQCKALKPFVFINKFNSQTIDFANPNAVKMLNMAILASFYGIKYWDIPEHYLCPPIPGRADYIHNIADLLATSNQGNIPVGKSVKVLDIGVGANCVYPIIGASTYGWRFVGTEIDPISIQSAKNIIEKNPTLRDNVEIRLQSSSDNIFTGVINKDEVFDIVICNPPFHSSPDEANFGTQRKIKNLSGKKPTKNILNFGGQNSELWCEGGEKEFVFKMIQESAIISDKCVWFTSLVSKKENLPTIYSALKNVKAIDIQTIDMAQGQKISRIVAWTFKSKSQRENHYAKLIVE